MKQKPKRKQLKKVRHVCAKCGGKKYEKFLIKRGGVWICYKSEKCEKRFPNYAKPNS